MEFSSQTFALNFFSILALAVLNVCYCLRSRSLCRCFSDVVLKLPELAPLLDPFVRTSCCLSSDEFVTWSMGYFWSFLLTDWNYSIFVRSSPYLKIWWSFSPALSIIGTSSWWFDKFVKIHAMNFSPVKVTLLVKIVYMSMIRYNKSIIIRIIIILTPSIYQDL